MDTNKMKAALKAKAAKALFRIPVSDRKFSDFLKSAKNEQMASLLNNMSQPSLYRMQSRLFKDCELVQKTVLYEILRANENTEFGKKHHFSKINGIKGYRKCVPISEWDDYHDDMKALEQGKEDVLFPGKAQYFY